MLSRLHVENFKAFKEPTEVPLAPLTLIFGANSSGKSALIQALALYGQSIRPSHSDWDGSQMITGRAGEKLRREGRIDDWAWSGSHVDLGGFKNLVFGHDSAKTMSIGVELREWDDDHEDVSVTKIKSRLADRGAGIAQSISTSISMTDSDISFELDASDSNSRLSAMRMSFATFWELYRMQADDFLGELGLNLDNYDLDKGVPDDELTAAQADLGDDEGFADLDEAFPLIGESKENIAEWFPHVVSAGDVLQIDTTGPLPLNAFFDYLDVEPDGVPNQCLNVICEVIQDATQELVRPLRQTLRGITYLGPVRAEPQRIEELHNVVNSDRSPEGQGTTGRLFRDPKLKGRVNEAFRLMEIPYEIDAVMISNTEYPTVGEFLALQLLDLRTSVPVSLADVGYGISQLLPIVTEAASEEDGPLLIEQPELHLHPRLQGKLAEFLAQSSQRRQVIAETHSESIVLRLQTLIRRGDLDPSDVAVIYVGSDDGEGSGSWIQPIEFGSTGEMLQEWPGGFFEDRLEDY